MGGREGEGERRGGGTGEPRLSSPSGPGTARFRRRGARGLTGQVWRPRARTHTHVWNARLFEVDWNLPWDVRLEGHLSGPAPEPWGVSPLSSALRGTGSEDELGASDAQKECPSAGLVSPVTCGWDPPTQSHEWGDHCSPCHPVTETGLLRRRPGGCRPPSVPRPFPLSVQCSVAQAQASAGGALIS